MEIKRYEGQLKKWNAERGFGFIVAAGGGQDIFVHISAFARDAGVPTQGEALTFEVEPDRNGKRSAVRVRRPGDAGRDAAPRHPVRLSTSGTNNSTGFFGKVISAYGLQMRWPNHVQPDDLVPRSNAVPAKLPWHPNGWQWRRRAVRAAMVHKIGR